MNLKEVLREFGHDRLALFGLTIVVILFATGIFAPAIAPYGYKEQNLDAAEQSISREHLLGTDQLGRDIFSRIVWGARTASFVVVVSLALGTPVGIILGAITGYFGGIVDTIVMRIADILFAFPGMLLIFFLASTLGPRIDQLSRSIAALDPLVKGGYIDYIVVVVTLSLIGWAGGARLVRGQFLSIKERDYIDAARCLGASNWRLIFRHILPNAASPIIVSLSMGAGGIILSEAFLSFLGIGIRPPNPSWGAMIFTNYAFWRTRPMLVWVPGLVIGVIILAFNFLGDGLNRALDPFSKRR
jgi:ABC-type dipeptide/oligopeptide/nickel transport system permease subunit